MTEELRPLTNNNVSKKFVLHRKEFCKTLTLIGLGESGALWAKSQYGGFRDLTGTQCSIIN